MTAEGERDDGDALDKKMERNFTGTTKIQLMQLATMLDVDEGTLREYKEVFDRHKSGSGE